MSSLFSAAPVAEQNQAISDYVGQVMAGGWSDQQKAQMIQNQANAMGVSADQIAAATGYSLQNVNAYLGLAQPAQSSNSQYMPYSITRPTEVNNIAGIGYDADKIAQAEQAARQAHMDMGMPGRQQGVDPSVYQTLYSTNANGQIVRNSDGFVAPFKLGDISNPNAKEYYQQNPQELFALGALGGGGVQQGYFQNAHVKGTNTPYGQLTPDQWYRGYTSNFADGWDQDKSNSYRWAGQSNSSPQPGGTYGGGFGNFGSAGGSGGVSGGSASSGTSSVGMSGLNPYLTSAQAALTQSVTDNMNRNILPGISSSAQAVGGFGGSRQGVVEANALKDANQQIVNGMANLGYNAYNAAMNADLQQQGINNSYNLGLGNLGLGYTQANNSFYNSQRGLDLQQLALANSMFNTGVQGTLAGGQGLYNVGNTVQQAPWQTIGNFGGITSPYTGFGTTTGSASGSTAAGVLGGALGGAQLFSLFGRGSGSSGSGFGGGGLMDSLKGYGVF